MDLLRLIRFPNLIIVALTQYLLQYLVIVRELTKINILPFLLPFHFFLLVITTVLIAAGGYIINDIEDVEIDRINKPIHKQIVGRTYPLSISWRLYWFTVILGFLISLYLAFNIHYFMLIIHPLTVILLWTYSKWLKQMPLIGNVLISFFCALVVWLIFYAQSLYQPSAYENKISYFIYQLNTIYTFVIYAILAFMSTLFREIVKDMEDVEGDRMANCNTLPILIGIKKSKIVAFMVGVLFISFIVYFCVNSDLYEIQIILLNLTISLPILYALFLLLKAEKKQDFSFLSKLAKVIMLSGLFFILILKL
jgi:4-hydroxybenzoate polyprenyltransferase